MLTAKIKNSGQDTDKVMRMFGKKAGPAPDMHTERLLKRVLPMENDRILQEGLCLNLAESYRR